MSYENKVTSKKNLHTSKRDIDLGLQLLLMHKTTYIVNERKTRRFSTSTRLQTINASCEANQLSTS